MPDEIKTNANDVVVAKEPAQDVDYEAQLKAKDATIAKLASDRDNYRRGMLAAKGKSPNDDEGETEEERIARIVSEQIANSEIAKNQREKDELIERMARDLKETKVALKNRVQVGISSGQGTSQDAPEVKTEFWTNAQKVALKNVFDTMPVGTKTTFEEFLEKSKQNYLKNKNS